MQLVSPLTPFTVTALVGPFWPKIFHSSKFFCTTKNEVSSNNIYLYLPCNVEINLISENITSLNSAISSSSCKMIFYFFADCQRAVIDEQKISGEVYIFCYWKISMPKMLKGFTLLFCGAPILHFNLIL
ncbi:hypothetical protein T4B_3244 [Trichinella pseudospiralis]|uniref:Uncharacterized protein n=1 Tax=Trichinella pseudospiralis TaxID=6337 RepID=A0A0V1JD44_TRIPS|nr:hypothetical protein T4B_3244 [Trichinella pseudospiralis]